VTAFNVTLFENGFMHHFTTQALLAQLAGMCIADPDVIANTHSLEITFGASIHHPGLAYTTESRQRRVSILLHY
jgi:hypothetical protein